VTALVFVAGLADAQRRPAVAKDADGSFVVVWDSAGQDGGFYGIFGQRFDSDGAVNNNGTITAADASIVLRKAVGQAVILNCPAAC